jgi:hypothetical protein
MHSFYSNFRLTVQKKKLNFKLKPLFLSASSACHSSAVRHKLTCNVLTGANKMPQISPQTAEAVQQSEGLNTAQFREGMGWPAKTVNLDACQDKVNRVLEFKARKAVQRQKEFEAGMAGGKPPSEMDQAAAQLWAALKEGKSLNELPASQVAQVYFILRDIQAGGKSGEFYQEATKDIKDPGVRQSMRVKEFYKTEDLIGDFERRLVGREYGKRTDAFKAWFHRNSWLYRYHGGERQSPAREILVLNDLIAKNKGNVEKAAAVYASDQMEAVLQERGEGVLGEVGKDKVDAAKQSGKPGQQHIAGAIEGAAGLTGKVLKERRNIRNWDKAEQYRKFIGGQLTEADLTDYDIALAIGEANPDLWKKGFKLAAGTSKKCKTFEEFEGWLKTLATDADRKDAADSLVKALVEKHSIDSIGDTAFDILVKLGDQLPEVGAKPATKVELAPHAGDNAQDGDIMLALSKGLTDRELVAKGFDAAKIKNVRRKYFYKDTATGTYKLREVVADNNADLVKEEKARKRAIRADARYSAAVDAQINNVIQKRANNDFTLLEGAALPNPAGGMFDLETELKGITALMRYSPKRLPKGFRWPPNNLSEIRSFGVYDELKNEWVEKRKGTYNNPSWRGSVDAIFPAVDLLIASDEGVNDFYNEGITKVRVTEAAALGTQAAAILKAEGKDGGNLLDAALGAAKAGERDSLIENPGTPGQKLKGSEQLASSLAKLDGVSLGFWALLISLGLIQPVNAFESLIGQGKNQEEVDLRAMLSGV